MDLVAPQHVGSSQTRDQTLVSCIGKQILYHWATREALWTSLGDMVVLSHSVMSSSLRPQWTVARQAPLSFNSPGKNTGVDCHFLLHGNLPDPGNKIGLLYCRHILYLLRLWGFKKKKLWNPSKNIGKTYRKYMDSMNSVWYLNNDKTFIQSFLIIHFKVAYASISAEMSIGVSYCSLWKLFRRIHYLVSN